MDALLRRRRPMRTAALAVLVLVSSIPLAAGAGPGRKSVIASWLGKRVVVRRTMHTLVFNERGKLGKTYHAKREGLVVVTPSAGTYCRFDGRDSEGDIVGREPQEVMDQITATYRRPLSLEIGFYLRIEPLHIVQYAPGGELAVTDVRVDRDRVRLSFGSVAPDVPPGELATALTIQWPTNLSPALTERPHIDGLIRQFVDDGASETSQGFGIWDSGFGIRVVHAQMRPIA